MRVETLPNAVSPVVSAAAPSGKARLKIVHETKGRLRVKMPILGLPGLDTEHLARVLRGTPEVRTVRINPGAMSVVFEFTGGRATRYRILDRLSCLTRDQMRFRAPDEDTRPSAVPLFKRAALLAALPVLPPTVGRVLAIATIAPRVLRGARSLVSEGITVEVLDALAVSLGALQGRFGTAVTTDFMMETGEYLEESTIRHSGALLQDLLMPNPEHAWIERDGHAVEVPFSEVRKGDRVVVQTGELVPVDGVVCGGAAQINQASITGESLPETKTVGDMIIAGSLVESGSLKIIAEQVGSDTTTAQIAAMIRESLEKRSTTEKRAERHANRQVYMTLGLGAATLLWTRDVRRLSSVFLVDYACPIKLSAPVAIRATMSEAVARGILIKGGPSIEKLAEVDTFVFDKTGTLTRGELAVTDVISLKLRGWSKARLLALAASLEEHSQHPLAHAIVAEAKARDTGHCDHGDVIFDVGHGLRAEVSGKEVLIGSRHFLENREGVDFTPHEAVLDRLTDEGKMALFIAVGGKPAGLIGLRDELRDDANETAARLRASGVKRLVMLTGDRRARAEGFGETLGFDTVHADLRPEDKARILAELQERGHKVAFVGDGINDAPALAQAHVGFSMSQGADIAQATSDITLMDDRISAVADAREASDRAMQIIRTNTNLALGINTGLFIAASAGTLSPVAAAVAHNGSTFGLLLYALSRAGVPAKRTKPVTLSEM
ncbi:heavy metal translocating P-type ATPase [Celeribacter persicus]|uniref:P-type Zn(2+) transporter n=1 Tax=Celeribacter persicus TaxID=1651082 RepID=A0A2T5HJY1_9RHOB|nr:heavy metal translocating P-type ATPase [Celeribacter persicus]PTQ71891.1 P-type E1-E2 ATPase/heavy metal translocating P-type ATPase [Celeribacter persicus]